MPEQLQTILRLVRDGHLSPEEAAPIIDALTDRRSRWAAHAAPMPETDEAGGGPQRRQRGRQIRVRVTERGRQVINLRIPLAFADAALRAVPGLGQDQAARIREAIAADAVGPIIDVEDPDGDGVLITLE